MLDALGVLVIVLFSFVVAGVGVASLIVLVSFGMRLGGKITSDGPLLQKKQKTYRSEDRW